MKKVNIKLRDKSYTVNIHHDLYLCLNQFIIPEDKNNRFVVFTQEYIFNKYGKSLIQSLQTENIDVNYVLLEDGESSKSLLAIEKLYIKLLEFGCDRSSVFIAFGGGSVGDTTGFVASTFFRGVRYYQVPTTLLAMVDSSIGGKTGINLDLGKNLVGTIWQPKGVIIDTKFLQTLPNREIVSGFAEIIKYGAILDADFFYYLSKNLTEFLELRNYSVIIDIIEKCVSIKARIIEKDENENDIRRILNFGHTIGHALEKYFGFDILRHGEAIAYGMLVAAELSIQFAGLVYDDYNALVKTIKKLPLPLLPEFDIDELFQIMISDKKVLDGNINFVLLSGIGKTTIINSIPKEKIAELLKKL